jgi:molecular chaperone GrpE
MTTEEKIEEKIVVEEKVETPTENKEKELTERLQRLQAEFENFRKRTGREKADIIANANADLISQLIPILDNFELSLKHDKDKGIILIYDELTKILEKQGLKKINTKEKFNPKFHEALIQVAGESHGEILEELQRGYILNDRLLRASKVKISTKTDSK